MGNNRNEFFRVSRARVSQRNAGRGGGIIAGTPRRPITSNCPWSNVQPPPIARVNESSVNFNSDPVSGHILHIPHPHPSREKRAALKPTTPTAACGYTHARFVHAHHPRTTVLPLLLPPPSPPYSLIYHLRSLTAFAFETRLGCNADNYETPELPRRDCSNYHRVRPRVYGGEGGGERGPGATMICPFSATGHLHICRLVPTSPPFRGFVRCPRRFACLFNSHADKPVPSPLFLPSSSKEEEEESDLIPGRVETIGKNRDRYPLTAKAVDYRSCNSAIYISIQGMQIGGTPNSNSRESNEPDASIRELTYLASF